MSSVRWWFCLMGEFSGEADDAALKEAVTKIWAKNSGQVEPHLNVARLCVDMLALELESVAVVKPSSQSQPQQCPQSRIPMSPRWAGRTS